MLWRTHSITSFPCTYRIATAAHNLGRVLWKLPGVGKPRGMQGCGEAVSSFAALFGVLWHGIHLLRRFAARTPGAAASPMLTA